jgi:glycosyltransferase involved in cell wall biosynthesis
VKPRVLFIGAFPPPGSPIHGGIVTSCRMLMQSDFTDRFDVVPLDSTQRSIPEPGIATRALLAAARVARFLVLLQRWKPDVLLVFASQRASFVEKCVCAAFARARGVPTVLLMRGGPFMDDVRASAHYRRFARLLLRNAAVIPCQGEVWRRFFRDELEIDDSRLPVVYNWTAPLEYLARPRQVDRPPGRLRILFLAWVDRAKGIFELLDAVQTLVGVAGLPDFELQIGGGGAHMADLVAAIADRGLGARVVVRGWVGRDEKRALYESADIFVLPSYAEGMPNSMIEAMSMRVPVVVTPVGSVPDVIRDGENGLVVPVRDVASLAAILTRLLSSPALRRRLGDAGFETARETFGLERGADALANAIHLALDQPAAPSARRVVRA